MKKLFRHWQIILLALIFWSAMALTGRAPWFAVIAAAALITLVYTIAASLIGKSWGLLPAAMLGFAPPFLGAVSASPKHILTSLALLLALAAFAQFLQRPGKWRLIGAGVALGLALVAHPTGIFFVPLTAAIAFAALAASIGVDWDGTDPHARRHRFIIRAMRYTRATLAVIVIGTAVVYLFYAAKVLPYWKGDIAPAESESSPLIVHWLLGNPALRPLGAYLADLSAYADALPVFKLGVARAFGTKLPLPLLILFIIAGITAAGRATHGIIADIFGKEPVLMDYIATNIAGFSLQLFTAVYALTAVTGAPDDSGMLLVLLPPLSILGGAGVKHWFANVEETLIRNVAVRIFVMSRNFIGSTVKTLALGALLLWYIITALIAAPHAALYTNIIGALLR